MLEPDSNAADTIAENAPKQVVFNIKGSYAHHRSGTHDENTSKRAKQPVFCPQNWLFCVAGLLSNDLI